MPNGTNEWINKNDFDSCIKHKSLKWCAKKQQKNEFYSMCLMGPRSFILVMHIIPSKLLYCSLSIIVLFGFLLISLYLATFTIEIEPKHPVHAFHFHFINTKHVSTTFTDKIISIFHLQLRKSLNKDPQAMIPLSNLYHQPSTNSWYYH